MKLLLVGGHTRNIGKTALVVDIIRAFPEAHWTAVKITQYGHGVCSINGAACGCAPEQHGFSIDEESSRDNRSDTSRFLVAGAERSLWVRTKQGRLAEALPALREALSGEENVIVESNSLMGLLRPALYLVVLDPSQGDFKDSAKLYLGRADALILRTPAGGGGVSWPGVSEGLVAAVPRFQQRIGMPLPKGLSALIRKRYFLQDAAFVPISKHLSS